MSAHPLLPALASGGIGGDPTIRIWDMSLNEEEEEEKEEEKEEEVLPASGEVGAEKEQQGQMRNPANGGVSVETFSAHTRPPSSSSSSSSSSSVERHQNESASSSASEVASSGQDVMTQQPVKRQRTDSYSSAAMLL